MSMTTSVVGIKPPDEKWKKMKRAYDACRFAGVGIPREIDEFFDFSSPDESGVVIDLDRHHCVKQFNEDMVTGLEVDLTKLPDDVKIIRFTNSY